MSLYRLAAEIEVAPAPQRPSLWALLLRRVQRVWLRRLIAKRGTWLERNRRCFDCAFSARRMDWHLWTHGLCAICWQKHLRRRDARVPEVLPAVPDLEVSGSQSTDDFLQQLYRSMQ